jgi:hypothetical protein
MANVTQDICGANDGQVKISITYSDTDGLITQIIENNTGARGTLTYTITDPNTGLSQFNTPTTVNLNTNSRTRSVQGAGLHMLFQEGTGRGAGTFGWVLPYNIDCSWSSR